MTINQLPPPTRTNGSLGITKINAQPIDVEEEELDAAEYNEAADWVILLRDAVADLELAGSVLPAVGGLGALWYGDQGLTEEVAGRDFVIGNQMWGADKNKRAQFAFAGAQYHTQGDSYFSTAGDMTVEFIMHGLSFAAAYTCLLHQGGSAATFERRYFMTAYASQLQWGFDDGTGEYFVGSLRLNPAEKYIVHATRVVSGGDTTLYLYVNGRLQTIEPCPGAVPADTGPDSLWFGSDDGGGMQSWGTSQNTSYISQLYIVPGVVWSAGDIVARARAAGLYIGS